MANRQIENYSTMGFLTSSHVDRGRQAGCVAVPPTRRPDLQKVISSRSETSLIHKMVEDKDMKWGWK